MHSIKHASNDVARWCDTVNTSCETPELGHKNWVKEQGGQTNQGPAAQLTMMKHTLRKEASALCCEAIQGMVQYICFLSIFLHSLIYLCIFFTFSGIF